MIRTGAWLFSFRSKSDKKQTKTETKEQQDPFYTQVVYRLGDLHELTLKSINAEQFIAGGPRGLITRGMYIWGRNTFTYPIWVSS